MRAYERLLNYVKVYTTSEDEQENVLRSQHSVQRYFM